MSLSEGEKYFCVKSLSCQCIDIGTFLKHLPFSIPADQQYEVSRTEIRLFSLLYVFPELSQLSLSLSLSLSLLL
jgi:hypothetical protein